MRRLWLTAVVIGGVLVFAPAPVGHAQLQSLATDGEIAWRRLDALLLHHAGRQDLVLRPHFAAGAATRALALIVPVPARPDFFGALAGDPWAGLPGWVAQPTAEV